jgi:preprotein translocase subunit YajC
MILIEGASGLGLGFRIWRSKRKRRKRRKKGRRKRRKEGEALLTIGGGWWIEVS